MKSIEEFFLGTVTFERRGVVVLDGVDETTIQTIGQYML
jgi:hypothetical protein